MCREIVVQGNTRVYKVLRNQMQEIYEELKRLEHYSEESDELLYNGTYLFVGSPKIGKSFFMAQIGYHISKGILLWDYPVRQGTVLYLALEDDYARLQKRLSRMFGMEENENFFLQQNPNL